MYTLIDVHLEKCFEVDKALISVGSTSRLGGGKKSSYFENKVLMNLRLKKIIITCAMVAVLVITLNV